MPATPKRHLGCGGPLLEASPGGFLDPVSRILIVEDEQDLANLLTYNLSAAGFETETTHSGAAALGRAKAFKPRSEEHTSELQSRPHLVCRLLLEKKKKNR